MTPQLEEARQLMVAAERDFKAFQILLRDTQSPLEITLFHAQQGIEKLIKAVLSSHRVIYRRTHDLLELEELARQQGLTVPIERNLLIRLGPYAVEFRYLTAATPAVSLEEARAALEAVRFWAEKQIV